MLATRRRGRRAPFRDRAETRFDRGLSLLTGQIGGFFRVEAANQVHSRRPFSVNPSVAVVAPAAGQGKQCESQQAGTTVAAYALPRLRPDFKEFLRLLAEAGVEYLIVGGYAVTYRGHPRAAIWTSGFERPRKMPDEPSGRITELRAGNSSKADCRSAWMAQASDRQPRNCSGGRG